MLRPEGAGGAGQAVLDGRRPRRRTHRAGPPRSAVNRRAKRIVAVALAPFVVLCVRAMHASWTATGDYSFIELRTRDVGTSHTPLVGPYSRFGWNHPGPALFFAFAAPYRAFASHSTGLLAGATLIGAVSTIAIVVVLIRRSPSLLVAAFGLLLVAALVRTLGAGFFWDPWNPYVIVLPFLAFTCFAWWTATGAERALPFAVGFGSFVAQTHVSLGLEVAVLLLVALGWLTLRERDTERRQRLRRAQLTSLAVLAVMWILPVVQEFSPGGGNIGELLRFWTERHSGTVGFAHAARLIGPQFTLPGPWLTRSEPVSPLTGALTAPRFSFPFALVALAIALVFAWRKRDRFGLVTASLALTAAAVGWMSFARIVGTPYPYLVRWADTLGPLCWFAVAVVFVPPLTKRLGRVTTTWITRAVGAAATILLVFLTASALTVPAPDPVDNHAASTLFSAMLPELRRLPAPLMLQSEFQYSANAIVGGLIARSVEDGLDARYPSYSLIAAGTRYVVNPAAARSYLYVVINADVASYSRNPAYRRIGIYDSLSPTDRAAYDQLRAAAQNATIRGQLTEYNSSHGPQNRRLQALRRRALLAAVFVRLPPH